MVRAAVGADAGRLIVRPLVDHLYDEAAWRAEVRNALASAVGRVALIGRAGADAWRDAFPDWAKVDVEPAEVFAPDDLRRRLFSDDPDALKDALPAAVLEQVRAHRTTDAFARAAEEWRHVEAYRRAWQVAPYPPTFVTADALVVCDSRVLLVERAGQPGRGLWALPGGFVDPHETTLAAAIREAGEETGLSAEALEGALKAREVFDAPDRSLRGRTITHAFRFDLPPGPLPAVAAADDAAQARWIPLAEVRRMRGRMFEDHYFILERLLGLA